jgi:hypothetical protein
MPADHAQQAFDKLLFGERVPAAPMGAFFLRDDVFVKDSTPTPADLIDTFRGRFDYPASEDADFLKLFDPELHKLPAADSWFEPAPSEAVEVLLG